MSWRRLGLIAAIALPLLLYYGNGYRVGCYELNDYVFTAEAARSSLGDGETTELKLEFYPVPDRRFTLHTSLHEHFDLWSSAPVENRARATLAAGKSPKKTKTYGKTRPLRISIPVTRKDQEDGAVLLDFGKFGTISVKRGATIELGAYFYPTIICAYDSREGVDSDQLMLHLE